MLRETFTNFAANSRGSFLYPQLKFKPRERTESYSEQPVKTKYHGGIVLYKNGEDNKCFMKYYILRLNQMHKKKLRCTTTSLGKHFALASQNLEYKMPELFLSYWGKKGL